MIETAIEADEVMERLKQCAAQIKTAESERDAFISHYQNKIDAAKAICDDKTKDLRTEIADLTEQLKRFAMANLPEGKKSIDLPTGTLQFRKASPRYFYDDLKPAAQDPRLIDFVKHNAREFLKVEVDETVDWQRFRWKLGFSDDGQDVFFADTGEIIDGLRAQTLPDTFKVELA